ncbi:DUF4123 domain-containing protein [Loktanella sp. F6476L]|uniref:DUF4123 domain-containing protein n=1 Tax=Loktanella sp. F6476L TaxID=2926405 RepID=UPI001FF28996|nr:DUF4123 domain-containing protein [Loktanella sp. F6476L]MCK0122692.1 DUF4123 domain-containing protein [Loktanella sp. F6476L]
MNSDPTKDEVPPLPEFLAPPPEKEAAELGLTATVFDPLEADEVARDKAGDTETPPLRAYLMLDASVDPDIAVCLQAFDSPARCLFDGAAFEELSEVGPWVVEITRYSDAWDWFVEDGFGNSWGIVIHSRLELMRLKVQMKKFIKITDDTGETYFFKFYRPEHFNTYIPAFDAAQLTKFTKGVETFFAEKNDDPKILMAHQPVDDQLLTKEVDLFAVGEPLLIKPPSPEEAQAWIDAAIAASNA